jgi:shikimate kinase
MNIVLIGYRGTGKTEVGKVLSQRLGWPLMQMDDMIVQHEGSPIPHIVKQHGWDYFRDCESRLIKHVAQQNNQVIDTGGGVILRQENIDALKKNGILFWLTADPDTIISRIKDDTNRPSLTSGNSFTEEVHEVLQQRLPLYKKAGDFTIDTAGRSVSSIADDIIKLYNDIKQGNRKTGQEAKRQRVKK